MQFIIIDTENPVSNQVSMCKIKILLLIFNLYLLKITPQTKRIQTRVAAQGLAVTVFTLGLCYHMYQTYKADKIVPADISTRITSSEVEKVQKK
jgi:hypothetical protein